MNTSIPKSLLSCLLAPIFAAAVTCAPVIAQPTLVAPRAVLLDPGDKDKVIMSQGLDSMALQGSIAKLMTAYTTSWAVKKGYVNWNDTVTLSKRDTTQACSCMKFGAVPNPKAGQPNQPTCLSSSITQVGEQFKLRDLLQVTLNQSTGELTDAVAEFVGRRVYGLPAATTPDESEHLMNLFLGLMNERAKELHLDNSLWITVHGGDGCDFEKGCNPTCTQPNCPSTTLVNLCPKKAQCGGGTTVHDLALLWHALTRDEPQFLPLIGVRAFELDTKSGAFYNTYGHAYNYYPGLDGDKNGGSGACPAGAGSISASCHIAQATRGGHSLIAAVLQSFNTVVTPGGTTNQVAVGTNDVTAMFRWGFAQVLKPERRVDSGNQLTDKATDHAIACNDGQCFTALRTPDSALQLVVWNVALEKPALTKLASGTGPRSVSAFDVDANSLGTVVAAISAGNMVLTRWWLTGGYTPKGLPPNVKLEALANSGTKGGAGTLVRVRLASDDLAITATRRSDGVIRLASWRMGSSSSPTTALQWLADGSSASAPNIGATGELTLATGGDPSSPGNFLAVTGDVTTAGAAALQLWRVNGKSGAVSYVQSQSLGSGRNISIANNGVGKFGVSLITGTATPGTPRVVVYDVSRDGIFTPTLDRTELYVVTETSIAPLGPAATKSGIAAPQTVPTNTHTFSSITCGSNATFTIPQSQRNAVAFLAATRSAAGAQLAVWDSPLFWSEVGGPMSDFRLVDSGGAWGAADDIRLARLIQTDPLLNQYVTQHVESDGTLLLIGWNVGHPTPFTPTLAKPKPVQKKPPLGTSDCLPCVCSGGFKAGPKVCADSIACAHICRGHGGKS